jgi:hypothetical protein
VTVLDPDHPDVHLRSLDVVVHGRCFPTKRAPSRRSSGSMPRPTSGDVARRTPPRGDRDRRQDRRRRRRHHHAEIEASHLDYLALGHWHSTSKGKAGRTTYAYSGAPEPVALDQDRAGNVLLVTLDSTDGKKRVLVEERKVGRRASSGSSSTPRRRLAAGLVKKLRERANPDLMLDVELIGVRPDELDVHVEEVESELADQFLKLRVRDKAVSPLPDGPSPRQTRSSARSSATSRPRSPSSRRQTTTVARASCATPFASAGCCSPGRS